MDKHRNDTNDTHKSNATTSQMETEKTEWPAQKNITSEGKATLQRMKEMLESKKVRL